MFQEYRKEIEWGGRQLVLETGKIARQADGWHVDVRLAPSRQRHVPALPELADILGAERKVEILHHLNAE